MAILFDETDDYVAVAAHASIANIFDGGGCVAFWANVVSDGESNASRLISKQMWLLYVAGDTTVHWYVPFTGANGDWTFTITNSVNVHIAVNYDSGSIENDPDIYLNAVLQTETEATKPGGTREDDSAVALALGAQFDGSLTMDGMLEDSRLYDSKLTVEQIAALAAGYRGPLGGEVCWLSMCEARTLATPGTLTQGTHTLSDLSVNSNDGDPHGNAVLVASAFPRMGMVV